MTDLASSPSHPHTDKSAGRGAPFLYSVVITTHNEARGIRHTIEGLVRQQGIDLNRLEVVLVDDRSTDRTVEEAKAAGARHLQVLTNDRAHVDDLTTRQTALDRGFRAARGKVVLTVDPDSDIPPDWIVRMTAPILAGRTDAMAGAILFRTRENAIGIWQSMDACFYLSVCALLAWLGRWPGVFFGNFAFRADLYGALGGFERIGFALTEDLAFARQLSAAGARIGFAPARVIRVSPCPSLGALIRRTKRVSAGPRSTLAFGLTTWFASLPLLAIAALFTPDITVALVLLVRWLLGAMLVLTCLLRSRAGWLGPFAPFYEPFAVALAAAVCVDTAIRPHVTWGGRTYPR